MQDKERSVTLYCAAQPLLSQSSTLVGYHFNPESSLVLVEGHPLLVTRSSKSVLVVMEPGQCDEKWTGGTRSAWKKLSCWNATIQAISERGDT